MRAVAVAVAGVMVVCMRRGVCVRSACFVRADGCTFVRADVRGVCVLLNTRRVTLSSRGCGHKWYPLRPSRINGARQPPRTPRRYLCIRARK